MHAYGRIGSTTSCHHRNNHEEIVQIKLIYSKVIRLWAKSKRSRKTVLLVQCGALPSVVVVVVVDVVEVEEEES